MEVIDMLENLELNKPDKPNRFYNKKVKYYQQILKNYG